MGSLWGETERVFFEMEGRGVLQDLILYVGQMELADVPVKGLIIDPNVHGLLLWS